MRGAMARYAGCVGTAVVVGSLGCAQGAPRAPDVHVTIACTPGRVNATVNGWVVRKNRTTDNTISVLFSGGGAGSADLTVTPKDASRWPFTPPPTGGSYVLSDNGRLDLTVNADATPGTYRYTVVGQCTISGATHAITIDPDIVVD